ncbi:MULTISPECIES: membrane protein [Crocosphaera]|uniref:Bacterial cell division membrane protein n=2 Tax=Crocosphaera watsonii TaxID=263511 RepID=T2JNN2_CROWT|nr:MULTISPECIES: membrane protein [Crocosphaera]MCH2244100.1 hypothetical protein [Crocosphaera sp.]NQZ63189.1 hypothetical protein [Crocosphaera sp.]CCQ66656.1 Bacterial cell division membrane protein [Crocosphaera watsonii WH 0402]
MKSEKQIILTVTVLFTTVFLGSLCLLIASPQVAILCSLLLPCTVLSYLFPRWGLLTFLIYLPLGGTITYGVAGVFQAFGRGIRFTGSYSLFHLAKDAFYLPALIGILIHYKVWKKNSLKLRPLMIVIALFVFTCLLTFFFVNIPADATNAKDKITLMGLVGLKVWLGYIPLILCAYYCLNNQKNLLLFNRFLLLLILIACSLCLIQYLFLVHGICPGSTDLPEPSNTSASLRAQCFVGGSLLFNPGKNLIRLPGTFVAPWQWAWFLIASSFISYGVSFSEPSRLWKGLGFVTIIAVLVATLISGQRTALLLVPIIYLVLLLTTQKRNKNLLVKLVILFIVSIIISTQIGLVDERIANFIQRWQYSPPQEFIVKQIRWITSNYITLLGNGLGKTASAARRLGSITLVETFPAQIIYEIGILGYLVFLSLVTTLTILTFKAYRSLKTPALRGLGLCLWAFILFISYNPYYYPLAVDPVAVYYWFIAGMLFKLPVLEQETLSISSEKD